MSEKKYVSDYPQLVKEWHPTLNENKSLSEISVGVGTKFCWKCSKYPDHVWHASPNQRVRKDRIGGCPYCSGNRVAVSNSLKLMNPKLSHEFSPKNKVPSETVNVSGNLNYLWKCVKSPDHEWIASSGSRDNGNGCPFCSGRSLSITNSIYFSESKNILEIHPHIPYQAHLTKINDRKSILWKCTKSPDHVWLASVKSRIGKDTKCVFCLGQIVSLSNSFMFHKLRYRLHPILNLNLPLDKTITGGKTPRWWKCSKGPEHIWKASAYDLLQGHGCPYCKKKKVTIEDSFLSLGHEVVKKFHPLFNQIAKHQLSKDSGRSIWWKCIHSPDHVWKSRPVQRGGCPYCCSLKTSIINTQHEEVVKKEWHPILNKECISKFVYGSDKVAFWKCLKYPDHVWQAPLKHRNKGSGCPYCRNLYVSISNSIYFSLAKIQMLHPINDSRQLINRTYGSKKTLLFKCRISPDHVWDMSLSKYNQGYRCPFCAGYQVSINKSLYLSSLLTEIHPKEQESLSLSLNKGSRKRLLWKCTAAPDHIWYSSVKNRNNGSGCPYCSGYMVSISNSLYFHSNLLSSEWDSEKNHPEKQNQVIYSSSKKIFWICNTDSRHTWKATLQSRSLNKTGCPYCNQGWTIRNLRLFILSLQSKLSSFTPAELYLIFQQSGLLKTDGKAKGFGKAIISGKIPPEELKKFANNEPSTVDKQLGIDSDTDSPESDQETIGQDLSEDAVKGNLSELELEKQEDVDQALPIIKTKDALEALELQTIASSDEEAITFLIASAKAKLWTHAYNNADEAKSQAETYQGGEYSTRVKEAFLNELRAALDLEIPIGYSFKVKGKVDSKLGYTPPLLMQRLCSVRVRDNKRYGNWSGTGAGKTISAILSTRVVGSKLTVICCPNAVVENWENQIEKVFPDSDVQFKTWEPEWQPNSKHRYLIQNFEQFQQVNSEAYIKSFIDREQVEFVVIDEIHYAKQRYKERENSEKSNVSRRKKLVQGLIAGVSEQNPNLYVLGMSATPVINNLFEGISLLEMMMGQEYADLSDRPTINNCMRLYQQLVTNGTRWVPDYSSMKLNRKVVEIDCSEYVPEIRALGKTPSPLSLEKILTQARLPTILEHILPNKKTLIYTHYVDDIDLALCDAIREKGFKVGFYTGKDKTGLKGFLHGDIDVLIGSSSIGTGVDGLQDVCNTLIINVLPWTNAEYEQLRGRIYRQGSSFHNIDIVIPLTYADIGGERWSYCESKWKRIQFKKSIADAAVDGVVPDGNLRTPAQAQKDLLQWLERLDSGDVEPIRRKKITVPLSGEFKDLERRKRKYGDFSTMNGRWNHSKSQTLAERLAKDPEEWGQYHTLYQEARKSWTVIPFEEMITWLKNRQGYEVGDFGCGEALLAKEIGDLHTVHSFDHIAINDSVTACDMIKTPLEDGSLDVAIFSLSLMGANFTDYLREAWRVLKVDGSLHIWEATSRFGNTMDFVMNLNKLGFDPKFPKERGKFTYITATKIVSEPDTDFKLKF